MLANQTDHHEVTRPSATPTGDGEGDGKAVRQLRILAADCAPEAAEFYRRALGAHGHDVAVVRTGRQLEELAQPTRPDLLVVDVETVLQEQSLLAPCWHELAIPVILVCDEVHAAAAAHMEDDNVMACLRKPLQEQHLPLAVGMAWRRHQRALLLSQEAAALRQALQDRKVIEQAKGAVMRRVASDEQEAFRRLLRLARDSNRTLAQVAECVLEAEKIFSAMEGERFSPGAPHADGNGHRPRKPASRFR